MDKLQHSKIPIPMQDTETMVNSENLLTPTHATERDVDLLLVEELACSAEFVAWIFRRVSSGDVRSSSVAHSKRRIYNRREIDITLSIEGPAGKTIILIENKLDTAEQPRQAESYAEEARTLLERREAIAATTVLICPRRYAATASAFARKFDHVILYEDVVEFLDSRIGQSDGELALRLSHRRELLMQAITKARRGYEAVSLPEIDQFASQYVMLLKEDGISLEPGPSMVKQGRPGESRTMIFSPNALPKWHFLPQTRLVHQLREGNANINLYGWGEVFNRIAAEVSCDLKGTEIRAVPTANKRVGGRSGLMLVVQTPAIDSLAAFDPQKEDIRAGVLAAAKLKHWFWSNKPIIEKWSSLIKAAG